MTTADANAIQCSICLSLTHGDGYTVVTHCGHTFHWKCMKDWQQMQKKMRTQNEKHEKQRHGMSCPMCRRIAYFEVDVCPLAGRDYPDDAVQVVVCTHEMKSMMPVITRLAEKYDNADFGDVECIEFNWFDGGGGNEGSVEQITLDGIEVFHNLKVLRINDCVPSSLEPLRWLHELVELEVNCPLHGTAPAPPPPMLSLEPLEDHSMRSLVINCT